MRVPPIPPDEAARLDELKSYAVLDTPAEAAFDDLVQLASRICGAPTALVNLIDHDRQWTKAGVGPDGASGDELPRERSFCAHALSQPDQLLVVPDAQRDARFATNPAVTADPRIRFYAGAPLVTPDGHALGALCVVDRSPRFITREQEEALRVLARQVVVQLELRRKVAQLTEASAARDRAHAALAAEEAERARLAGEARLAAARASAAQRFRALVERSADGIVLAAADGTVQYASPAVSRMLGFGSDELTGRHVLARVHPDDVSAVRERFTRLLRAPGATVSLTYRQQRADGVWRWLEAMGTNLLEEPDVAAVVVNVRDVTELREQAASLLESNAQLKQALEELLGAQSALLQQERLRALGEMASGIAHDLNNALAPVVGFSELLLDRPGTLEDRELVRSYLELIRTGAGDAASVVGRLREFYRLREADEPREAVDLSALVTQCVDLTRPKWRGQAQSSGRTIVVDTDLAPVPPVAGNASELREALTNVIFNAVDAIGGDGRVTLRTRSAEGMAVVEVSDTGAGMSEEVRLRCLEPFFTTKGERGTGLGLAMVWGIVHRHGGSVEIESEVGCGTTIRLCFPTAADTAGTEADAGAAAETARDALRVLVVDDEAAVRAVVVAFLQADGHAVVAVGSGAEALERLRAEPFDLVITDRAMPGMSGDRVAAAVKEWSPRTPVLLLTGFGDLMSAAGESPAGVDAILGKPVTLAKLRATLATLVPRLAQA